MTKKSELIGEVIVLQGSLETERMKVAALRAENERLDGIRDLLIKSLAVALGRKPTDVKLLENPLTLALQHAAVHGASPSSMLTYTIGVDRDGVPHSRTQTHGSTFADCLRAFEVIKREVDHQIIERNKCPANPNPSIEETGDVEGYRYARGNS